MAGPCASLSTARSFRAVPVTACPVTERTAVDYSDSVSS